MRLHPVAAFAATASLLAASPALGSDDVSAPAYPGSKLHVSVSGTPRAGSLVSLHATGSNAADDGVAYTLDGFVHTRALSSTCPRSLDEERQRVINTPSAAINVGSGLSEGMSGPFSIRLKYRSGKARKVVICAYSRYITDDAALAALRHTLAAPKKKR